MEIEAADADDEDGEEYEDWGAGVSVINHHSADDLVQTSKAACHT